MKVTNPIIIILILGCTTFGLSQTDYKYAIEVNADYGISNDYSETEKYRARTFGQFILVDERSSARTRNFQFSIAKFFNRKNGAKISFGLSEFGFDINGRNDVSLELIRAKYRIRHLEWGASYVRKFSISEASTLIIEPGIRYHSDGDTSSPDISIAREDSFSFSLYSGIEVPMIGSNLFANIGIQLKIPLQKYSYSFDDTNPEYYPYFIGLKFGVNFQFFARY